jgi:hypothetical protein
MSYIILKIPQTEMDKTPQAPLELASFGPFCHFVILGWITPHL